MCIICPFQPFPSAWGSPFCRLLVHPSCCLIVIAWLYQFIYLPLFVAWGFSFSVVPLCCFFLPSLWLFLPTGLVSSLPLSPVLKLPLALVGLFLLTRSHLRFFSATGSSLWAESVPVWPLCTSSRSLVFHPPVDFSLCLHPPASIPLLLQSAVPLG